MDTLDVPSTSNNNSVLNTSKMSRSIKQGLNTSSMIRTVDVRCDSCPKKFRNLTTMFKHEVKVIEQFLFMLLVIYLFITARHKSGFKQNLNYFRIMVFLHQTRKFLNRLRDYCTNRLTCTEVYQLLPA